MTIPRIISIVILFLAVFVTPWWLFSVLLLAAVIVFAEFYEAAALALIADLFYSHSYFASPDSVGIFIPLMSLVSFAAVIAAEKIKKSIV